MAAAITDKGIETSGDASFEEIAASIRNISTSKVVTGVVIDKIIDYAYATKED